MMKQRVFNVEQTSLLNDNCEIRISALFQSYLLVSQSSDSFERYQRTYSEFLKCLMNKNLRNSREVMVNFSKLAVEQLFPEIGIGLWHLHGCCLVLKREMVFLP